MSISENWMPDKSSGIPLYQQIKDYIRYKISSGDWAIGTQIPTQREFARRFDVNRSTIVTAIDELIAEGLLEGKTKGGTIVKNNTWSLLSKTPPPDWLSYVRSGTHQPNFSTVQQINRYEFEPEIIRLGTGELSPELFPKKMMDFVTDSFSKSVKSLGYEEPKGSYELRREVSAYLSTLGINASPSQILIVSGALQALHLISVGILYKGSTILTENPSYIYSINVFQSAGMKLYGIPMDEEGIQINKIIRYRRQTNAAILYAIPSFQNPAGVCMKDERRKKLLGICEDERLPIIEDDAYRELYIDKKAPIPLKSMDNKDLVLFLGSMSKSLCPGLRIGWVVGQEAVIERLADIKMQTDYGSSSLSQRAAAEWLSSGLYFDHLVRIRKELKIRRNIALDILNQYFSDIAEWKKPEGGFYIWLCLKKPLSLQKLFNNCLKKGILINPGNVYQHISNQHIRISYSYASHEDLKHGLVVLSLAIRELYQRD